MSRPLVEAHSNIRSSTPLVLQLAFAHFAVHSLAHLSWHHAGSPFPHNSQIQHKRILFIVHNRGLGVVTAESLTGRQLG